MENKELDSKIVNNNEVSKEQSDLVQGVSSINKQENISTENINNISEKRVKNNAEDISKQGNGLLNSNDSNVKVNDEVKVNMSSLNVENNIAKNEEEGKGQGITIDNDVPEKNNKVFSDPIELPKSSEISESSNNMDFTQVVKIPQVTEDKGSPLSKESSNSQDISINTISQNNEVPNKDVLNEQENLSNKKRNPFAALLNNSHNDKKVSKGEDSKENINGNNAINDIKGNNVKDKDISEDKDINDKIKNSNEILNKANSDVNLKQDNVKINDNKNDNKEDIKGHKEKKNPFAFFLNNDKTNKNKEKHNEVNDKAIKEQENLASKETVAKDSTSSAISVSMPNVVNQEMSGSNSQVASNSVNQAPGEIPQKSDLPIEIPKTDISSNEVSSNSINQVNLTDQVNQNNQIDQTNQNNEIDQVSQNNQVNQANPLNAANQPDFSTIFNVQSEEVNNVNNNQGVAPQISGSQMNTESNSGVTSGNQVTQNKTSTINPEDIVVTANAKEIAKNKKKEAPKEVKKQPKEGVFNNEEKVIYEYVPEKEGNPIGVAIFFLLLFGFILALPSITKKYDFSSPESPTESKEKETENSKIYYFNKSSVRASLGGLEFTNFVKSKKNNSYYLTFNITNTNDKAYQYDKKYYVTFYDGESIAYRALIHSYEAIGSNSVQEITLTINERGYTNADRFKIEEIPVSMYPEVSTTETDGDYTVLTCAYQNDTLKYYFQDNKLIKLREEYDENLENSTDLEANKAAYRTLSDSYKRVQNFSSTFIETNNGFTMINEFNHKDIPDATLYNLKTYKFFKYNENINTVSFELEGQGYNCG